MKKVIIMFLIIVIVVGVIIFTLKNNFNIDNKEECECHNPELLVSLDDKNIYTYCIKNPTIKIDNKKVKLKEYIKNNKAINEIIDTLKLEDILKDGGTKIYKGDITLIKCNTLDGNKDIYIGNKNMEFKENFCKNNNYTFIRTYTVKDISKYTKQQYADDGTPVTYGNSFKVKLSEFKGKTKTVIINNLWDITLEKDKTYEFEFMINEDVSDIKDEIEDIFKYSTIISVKETTKKGLEQIQEPMFNK